SDEFRIQPPRHQRADIGAVLGTELGTGRRSGCVMATCLTSNNLAPVDVVRDCRFGRQRTSLVDRRIDILPLPGNRPVDQRGHYGHVCKMAAYVPSVTATGSDGRRVWHVCLVIATGGHLTARCHVKKVAGEVIPPRAGLAKGG